MCLRLLKWTPLISYNPLPSIHHTPALVPILTTPSTPSTILQPWFLFLQPPPLHPPYCGLGSYSYNPLPSIHHTAALVPIPANGFWINGGEGKINNWGFFKSVKRWFLRTKVLSTEVISTEVLSTEVFSTKVLSIEVLSKEVFSTEVLFTEVPYTEVLSTEVFLQRYFLQGYFIQKYFI